MDYQKLIEHRNATNAFSNHIGVKITKISQGYAETTLIPTKNSVNPTGVIHGGVLYAMADIATGSAAASYGFHVATINSSFNFLRAGINTTSLKGIATERKHGKNIMVFDVSIYDQDDKELAEGSFTYTQLKKEIELY